MFALLGAVAVSQFSLEEASSSSTEPLETETSFTSLKEGQSLLLRLPVVVVVATGAGDREGAGAPFLEAHLVEDIVGQYGEKEHWTIRRTMVTRPK